MARSAGDEELQLKKRARRRLIGATILVMVVVLVLPMVLDTEPKPVTQDIDIRIPSPDAGAFKSKIVPIAPAPDAKSGAKAAAGGVPAPESTAKQAPAPKTAPIVVAAPTAKPDSVAKDTAAGKAVTDAPAMSAADKPSGKDEAKKPAEVPAGAHVVQVAALLNAERAKSMHERLRNAGITAYTETVSTARGEVTRVRAGPFPTSEAAEKAREQINRIEFDGKRLEGKVIPVK